MTLVCESQCMERNKTINNTVRTQFIIEHLNIVLSSAKKYNSPSDNWRKKRKFKDVHFLTWNQLLKAYDQYSKWDDLRKIGLELKFWLVFYLVTQISVFHFLEALDSTDGCSLLTVASYIKAQSSKKLYIQVVNG